MSGRSWLPLPGPRQVSVTAVSISCGFSSGSFHSRVGGGAGAGGVAGPPPRADCGAGLGAAALDGTVSDGADGFTDAPRHIHTPSASTASADAASIGHSRHAARDFDSRGFVAA